MMVMASVSALAPDPPRSAEESDSLERSTKRIKDDPPPTLISTVEAPNQEVAPLSQKSFKDSLIDGNSTVIPSIVTLEELMVADSNVQNPMQTTVDLGLGILKKPIPKAFIPKEIWQKLCVPWRNSLIIKLLGKRIHYHLLCSRLSRVWQTEGGFEVIDIGNGYYVAKFSSPETCSRILTGGPYKIFDHYVAVQPWEPNFQPSWAQLPKTAIWVDRTTLLATRGEFACVCVEVDLNESLPSMIDLDLEELPQSLILVKYEGLHKICFECGEFGHKKEACHYRQLQSLLPSSSQAGEGVSTRANLSANSSIGQEKIPELVADCMEYGSWMVVKRKPRKMVKKQSHIDSVPSSTKGLDNAKGDNASTSNQQSKPIIQEKSANIGNKFGVIAIEEDVSTEIPVSKEPTSGQSPTQKEGVPGPINMESSPCLLVERHDVATKPITDRTESSKLQTKSRHKKDKAKKFLARLLKCPNCLGLASISPASHSHSSLPPRIVTALQPELINGNMPPPNLDLASPLMRVSDSSTLDPGNMALLNSGNQIRMGEISSATRKNVLVGADSTGFMPISIPHNPFPHEGSSFGFCRWLMVVLEKLNATFCTVFYYSGNTLFSFDWKRGHSGAWVLMGDFNDVASFDEIFPRSTNIFNRIQRFRSRMDCCGLMDMATLGCKYTWCRIRDGRIVLRERLDRVLLNSDAQVLLHGAKAFTLPRTCSDHHPILLSLDTAASHPPPNKPVRFEAAWLSRDYFSSVFTHAWSKHSNQLSAAINTTGKACISWGRSIFGNIFRKKRLLKARIAGIQNSPRYYSSSLLQGLEKTLLKDYQKVLYKEELLWFQKSRVDWIASRDRNTSFYHMSTVVRRNKNKIGALKIREEWNMDLETLKLHVRSLFQELFTQQETSPLLENLSTLQPLISNDDHESLIQPATLEEVKRALFSMKGLKSPGPDGIPALFYQRHWDTVAGTFLEFVNQALLTGVFDPSLIKAYVALIPKDDCPDTIQKFRPISLLNVAYKVLLDFNLPQQLINLIMFSVTSVQLEILWNGEPLPPFTPQQGLRQGDPLSPYLFILVMEKLAQMIQSRVDSKAWKPFKLSRGGVSLSHLFFADDLMLFAQASREQMDVILDCLTQFARSSGLVLNLQKSKLFLSSNVHATVANLLSTRSGISLTSNLGTYLGIPISHGRHSHRNYKYILEKMQTKLSNWKGAHLSLAGRRVLIQSVTTSIPSYTMQAILLPKATCDAIDRLNRNFLWGSDSGACKPHLVSWDIVCLEKRYGGLGLRAAWDSNQAFVAKLGWRLLHGDNALWCRVLRAKYLRDSNLLEARLKPKSSFIWRGILQCCPVLKKGLRWRIGSGERVRFWHDNWVGHAPLAMEGDPLPTSPSLMVADVINQEGEWDLDYLNSLIPADVIEVIRAIPLSRHVQLQDNTFWSDSMDGSFSVKSAYHLIQRDRNLINALVDSWTWIWKLQCAERIMMFVWFLVRGRVLTNSVRFARHMTSSPVCPRCDSFIKTPVHLLRDCYYAKLVWGLLGFATTEFFTLELFSWLRKFSASVRLSMQAGISRGVLFLSAIWFLWKDRNSLIFENHRSRPQDLCALIFQQAKFTMIALNSILLTTPRQPRWVSWMPPVEGWFKLNSDGSYNLSKNSASAGGLIRDSSRGWVVGFTINVGCASIFIAELWGLREGLRRCKSLGLP
ncbi:hypothetical protein SLEP1_g52559 [Rubroshorea leprosula]|uniref:Uncharacterized protein n=1 Tax=Rubroshorea leprosula TaxID=152421 RepID=A0AAV5MA30_9ROSI|nr:hypothetical protein SLEP1_g52559 [Rubroshorea leprosula]